MQDQLNFYRKEGWGHRFVLVFFLAVPLLFSFSAVAQCPPNIDFETGTFNGWTCYTGSVAAIGSQNVIALAPSGGPIPGRHTMYSSNSGETDPYGGFSVSCPNGSRYSVKLGNDLGGGEAEGISYEFTIPANQNVYSLIYHYAVVFQDPNHQINEQPRMETEITNVTDNTIISCSSFSFFPYGSILPGFFLAGNPMGDTPVWCKDWSAVTINLNGNAGKTIRLFFKTADCTFRKHFGYAYIDVNSECSSEFVGATYCNDDTTVNLTAPYGYQQYTWYNSNFSQILGHDQTIQFNPPPAVGTTIAVQVEPYNGYGCPDTLYAKLIDTLTVTAQAGPDVIYCGPTPVQLGTISKPGLVYSWSPPLGLSNSAISNPFANPNLSTSYILTTRHDGGGCVSSDTVLVTSLSVDNTLQLIGDAMYCITSGDSSILRVHAADSIQWFKDDVPIHGATHTDYRVTQSGNYHAMLFNFQGCTSTTVNQNILIDVPHIGIRYPLQYAVINLPLTLHARQFGSEVLWKPPVSLDQANSVAPVFNGAYEQLYTIEIKTASGCLTVDTQLVKTVKNVEVYVPTAFTPNGDGLNDYLVPVMMGIKDLHYFRVYNRWGQMLYEMRAENKGWDGKISGVLQGTGVVVWVLEGIGVDGKTYIRKGTSVLVR